MPNSNRNKHSIKGGDEETRNEQQGRIYIKMPDKERSEGEQVVSKAGDTANGRYARLNMRKDEKKKRAAAERSDSETW